MNERDRLKDAERLAELRRGAVDMLVISIIGLRQFGLDDVTIRQVILCEAGDFLLDMAFAMSAQGLPPYE